MSFKDSVHVFQLIDEVLSEGLELVDVELWRFGSEGHTFRCVQHKEQIHRTLCRKTEVESQHHLWFKSQCSYSMRFTVLVYQVYGHDFRKSIKYDFA